MAKKMRIQRGRRTRARKLTLIAPDQAMLTQAQAARYLGISRDLLRKWVRGDRLRTPEHFIRHGRTPSYRVEVIKAIAAQGIDDFAPRPTDTRSSPQ